MCLCWRKTRPGPLTLKVLLVELMLDELKTTKLLLHLLSRRPSPVWLGVVCHLGEMFKGGDLELYSTWDLSEEPNEPALWLEDKPN